MCKYGFMLYTLRAHSVYAISNVATSSLVGSYLNICTFNWSIRAGAPVEVLHARGGGVGGGGQKII